MIDEAIEGGNALSGPNKVHPANTATRYIHPKTGLSVVIDDATKEVLYVEKQGHLNPWSK